MTSFERPYDGCEVTFATMHGKERLARDAFLNVLGASINAPAHFDTDQFGSFAGDVPRILTPHAAARAKARSGMQLTGTTLALASEGSFSAGFGPVVVNREILLFIDDMLDLELIEGAVTTSSVPGGRRIATVDDGLDFARTIGFPDQGLIVQVIEGTALTAHKNITSLAVLAALLDGLFAAADGATITVLPDYRAHRAPSRAAIIGDLCLRMATRLSTPCARCRTPGFGRVSVEYGLPCSLCGSATRVIAADLHGCGRCDHTRRVARPDSHADPSWCDDCNP